MTAKGLMRGWVAGLLVALAMAGSARAQGMFYAEEKKDGRIYVFAIPKEHELWLKSGETGKAITRLGYGPNGETVVFDSEQAIGLFNFKHGKPGEAFPEPKKPKQTFAWKDGKTSWESDRATLTLSNRIQVRFTQEMPDDEVQLPGTTAAGDSKGSFRIRRAKTKFEGWFYKKEFTYELQLNWPDTANPLEDAWMNADLSKNKTFQVKFGQYKVPFGRQELTSSGSQQFVDRSIVSSEYAKGRDQGVQLHGLLGGEKLEWRAGMFNGNGRTAAANDNDKYQFNARLQFAPNGDPKYSETDFESKDKPLWAIAGGFEVNDLRNATTAVDNKRTIYAVDGVFKYKGISLFGEAFFRELDPEPATPGAVATAFNSDGYHFQAGYLFAKQAWELAFRYASWDPSDLVPDNDRTEIGGALNYFYNKHNLKVQGDVRQLEDKARDTKNVELRVQAQFIF
jgi:hypothetical protein